MGPLAAGGEEVGFQMVPRSMGCVPGTGLVAAVVVEVEAEAAEPVGDVGDRQTKTAAAGSWRP